MKKVILTDEFYKTLYKKVSDYCEKYFENEDNDKYVTMSVSLTIGDYDIECDAEIECEYVDESFNHAFGTWHDDYAGYYFGKVYTLTDVHVYDEDGEVEGFNEDTFDKFVKAA